MFSGSLLTEIDLNYSCIFMLNLSRLIEWSDHKVIWKSSGKFSRHFTLIVIPGGDVVKLIAIFTQHMSYSYGKFISVSVGAYTLEAALMGCSVDKGCVKSTLRVWKSLEVEIKQKYSKYPYPF